MRYNSAMKPNDRVIIRDHPSDKIRRRRGTLVSIREHTDMEKDNFAAGKPSGVYELTHYVLLTHSVASPYVNEENCVVCKRSDLILG
jgi:hypothetical protein